MSKIYTSADQLIGHTPLLELTHIENAENLEAKILAKLEYFNPAGSVKDRIARAMIDDAEATGKLKPAFSEGLFTSFSKKPFICGIFKVDFFIHIILPHFPPILDLWKPTGLLSTIIHPNPQ